MNSCYKDYEGCHIKGIPIGIPFKSKFFIPKSKKSIIKDDIDVFVLLRFNASWLDDDTIQNRDPGVKITTRYQREQSINGQSSHTKKGNHYLFKSSEIDNSTYNHNESTVGTDELLEEMEVEKVKEILLGSIKAGNDLLLRLFHADIPRVFKAFQVMELCKTVCTRKDKEKLLSEEPVSSQRKIPDNFLALGSDPPSKINKPNGKQSRKGKGKVARSRCKVEAEKQELQEDSTAKVEEPESINKSTEQDIVIDTTDKLKEKEESEDQHIPHDNVSLIVRNSDVIPCDTNLETSCLENEPSIMKSHAKDKGQRGKKRKREELDAFLSPEDNKTMDSNIEINIAREDTEVKTKEVEEKPIISGSIDTQDCVSEENKLSKLEKSDRNSQKKQKNKDVKKKKVMKDNAGEESDPDLQGLSIKEKLQVMRQRKKIEKESQRIKVKLQDHPDKYRIDIMDSFARKDRGKSRYESATEIFVCTVCEKFKAKSMDSMESHIESHVNGELNCDKCPYIAPFINDLIRHKREVHKKNINICYECGVETNGPDGLKDHLGKVHGKPQYKCKFCLKEKGEHFAETTKHNYRQHIRQVHPEQMSACPTCSRLFANQTMLKRHLDLGCAGNMPSYACEKCGKTYNSQERVNDHVRRVHNKVRRFQCPHCPFTAARGAGLNQHLHIHTGFHPFKCDQCTFTCVQKYQLTSHMRTHNGLKPYKCNQCNFAAAWNVQLKDHMKVHGMINTVVCEVCNILFKDMRTYRTHVSKEHAEEARQTITETPEIHQPIVQPFENQQVLMQPLDTVNIVTQQTSFQPLPNNNQFLQPWE